MSTTAVSLYLPFTLLLCFSMRYSQWEAVAQAQPLCALGCVLRSSGCCRGVWLALPTILQPFWISGIAFKKEREKKKKNHKNNKNKQTKQTKHPRSHLRIKFGKPTEFLYVLNYLTPYLYRSSATLQWSWGRLWHFAVGRIRLSSHQLFVCPMETYSFLSEWWASMYLSSCKLGGNLSFFTKCLWTCQTWCHCVTAEMRIVVMALISKGD